MRRDLRERIGAACERIGGPPAVVEVERRAVVDQPELLVPRQEIRIAWRAIDVGHERIEQEDARRGRGVRQGIGDERLLALTGATELHDVHPEIVAFDERRDRAALAKGQHVTSGADGAEHGARV